MAAHSILVIGAGELGTYVLEALKAHSEKTQSSTNVTVLTRPLNRSTADPKKQAQRARFSSLGISSEEGDIESASVAELATIFKKYHTVVSCTGMYASAGTQLKLTRAILAAGVRRYFPWQYGIDYDVVGQGSAQDLFDEQLEVRALLRGQREVDWVVVSTGIFMSFLFVPEFGVVDLEKRVLRGLGGWDTRVSATTPRDIGRMVAEIVYDPRGIGREVVYVTGDTVSYGRVADLVEKRFGGKWRREIWDREFLERRLEEESGNAMVKYQNVFAAGQGVAWDMERTVNRQRNIELEDLETYLRGINEL